MLKINSSKNKIFFLLLLSAITIILALIYFLNIDKEFFSENVIEQIQNNAKKEFKHELSTVTDLFDNLDNDINDDKISNVSFDELNSYFSEKLNSSNEVSSIRFTLINDFSYLSYKDKT